MKTYSISQLAREFGLSRSTLLYYDRIGLLTAPERTAAGYRVYTQVEHGRLEQICTFRSAGLALVDVQRLLSSDKVPSVRILEKRLRDLGVQIIQLRKQQHEIVAMLKKMKAGDFAPVVNEKMWVKMLEAAGMDAEARSIWHAEFEKRAPDAHFEFLLSIGFPRDEALKIRKWARKAACSRQVGEMRYNDGA